MDDQQEQTGRMARWEDRVIIDLPMSAESTEDLEEGKELTEEIWRRRDSFRSSHPKVEIDEWATQPGLMKVACEIVYDHGSEGDPVFHVISYSFNPHSGFMELGPNFDILIEGDADDRTDSIRNTLAVAHMYDVPVFPNTEDLADELAKHYRDMMVHGFTAPLEDGEKQRLILTRSPGQKIETVDYLRDLDVTEMTQPADWALIRGAVDRELGRLSEADRLLAALEMAIGQLKLILRQDVRDEASLQECLTSNPVLFGLEYRAVHSKHRLGAEYEMDYALERFSGLVDLVEIEPSTFPLFNKKGNPSHQLVHAEQQILDWLAWLEANRSYAERSLPGILDPVGFVVIGRSGSLRVGDRDRLLQRNALFRDRIRILTYDDLISRAQGMLELLKGSTEQSDG